MKIAIHRLQCHSLRENTRGEAGNATEHAKASKEMISACMLPFYPPSGRGLVIPIFFPWFFFWWSLAPDLRFSLGQTNTRRIFC